MIFPLLNHMHTARPLPMPCEENGKRERTCEERSTLAFEGEEGKNCSHSHFRLPFLEPDHTLSPNRLKSYVSRVKVPYNCSQKFRGLFRLHFSFASALLIIVHLN